MTEKETMQDQVYPNTKASLIHDLKQLGLKKDDTIICHVAMSKLGWVCGREVSVLDALLTCLEEGTLIMPSQTGDNSMPEYWQNPPVPEAWIPLIKENMPPFDPQRTPVREMGRVVEALLKHPQALRSNHPQVSFCGIGKDAKTILTNHQLSPGLGIGSPLQKLYERHAKILLLGVGYGNCTSLHLAETKQSHPKWVKQGAKMLVDKQPVWQEFMEIAYDDEPFEKIGAAFEKTHQVKIGKVGKATARLIDMRELCDFALDYYKQLERGK